MPRLTSKMTVKIEPDLLERIQGISESRGISVSYYVREALIEHIRDTEGRTSGDILRIKLTRMEARVLEELNRIGVIARSQDLFHRSFDSYLANELNRTMDVARKLEGMKPFSVEDESTDRITESFQGGDPVENNDLEGDNEDK